jgi:hypothetical protein
MTCGITTVDLVLIRRHEMRSKFTSLAIMLSLVVTSGLALAASLAHPVDVVVAKPSNALNPIGSVALSSEPLTPTVYLPFVTAFRTSFVYLPLVARQRPLLFVGMTARWDSVGFGRGGNNWRWNANSYNTRSLDSMIDADTIRSNNYWWIWFDRYGSDDISWYSYLSVSTLEYERISLLSAQKSDDFADTIPARNALSSTVPVMMFNNQLLQITQLYRVESSCKSRLLAMLPGSFILPYRISPSDGTLATIDGQIFLVSGPYPGYTAFGQPMQFWRFTNKDKFLFWDDGDGCMEYAHPGDITLLYDAGSTRLLIHRNELVHRYYYDTLTSETTQWIWNLTSTNAWPTGQSTSAESYISTPIQRSSNCASIDPVCLGSRANEQESPIMPDENDTTPYQHIER